MSSRPSVPFQALSPTRAGRGDQTNWSGHPAPDALSPPTLRPCRFAKLLLRLPALRSIGLKCLEHLFFFKLIGDTPIDTFLMEMLETPLQIT